MMKPVSLDDLKRRIAAEPRVRLCQLPTPLHAVPRFSAAIGAAVVFLKRDDLTGLAFGGNKSRMFEFVLADALKAGADTIVGGAGLQSNYCRQLIAACNSLGLEIHLVLRRTPGQSESIQGNLLLDLLAGANLHVIDSADPEHTLQRTRIFALADELRKEGKKPYVVRMANDQDLSSDVISYVNCFCEIVEQCHELNVTPSRIYVAAGDTTQAGLELGKRALGIPVVIQGACPDHSGGDAARQIAHYANQAARRLGLDCTVEAGDIKNTEDYVGKAYGIPTPEGIAMLKLMARTEGIFLDPVYTSKAMVCLADHVAKGIVGKDETVIFLHTGGNAALFAFAEYLDTAELSSHLSYEK